MEEAVVQTQDEIYLEKITEQRPGNTLSYSEKLAILRALEELESRKEYQGHLKYFPDDGPCSYHKYVKHLDFMRLGATHRERMFMAANRAGKTLAGGYELTCHLTGIYPHWWEGKRFYSPVDCWAAGDTSQTTRDIIQSVLMGEQGQWGTGLIPKNCIAPDGLRMRPGVPGGLDTVKVVHASGGISKLGFKSYDQKRRGFNGVGKHVIWLDEEPPLEVYVECLMRTMTTDGIVMVTFTPLMGITEFVEEFLNAARESGDIPY